MVVGDDGRHRWSFGLLTLDDATGEWIPVPVVVVVLVVLLVHPRRNSNSTDK